MKVRYYFIGIIIVIIDQLSKILIQGYNFTIIPKILKFTYTVNRGGAFGIGEKYAVLVISLIIIIGMIIYIIKENSKISKHMPFVLILSGAISNLLDRVFRGYVIDFIDFNIFEFPNFNIADICITIGIFYLLLRGFKKMCNKKLKI